MHVRAQSMGQIEQFDHLQDLKPFIILEPGTNKWLILNKIIPIITIKK